MLLVITAFINASAKSSNFSRRAKDSYENRNCLGMYIFLYYFYIIETRIIVTTIKLPTILCKLFLTEYNEFNPLVFTV